MAEKFFHNKLVRDKIPYLIEANNGQYESTVLNKIDFKRELRKKLVEEAKELEKADETELLEELADVMEIVQTIAANHKIDLNLIEEKRQKKKETRGGFEKRVFLIWSDKETG